MIELWEYGVFRQSIVIFGVRSTDVWWSEVRVSCVCVYFCCGGVAPEVHPRRYGATKVYSRGVWSAIWCNRRVLTEEPMCQKYAGTVIIGELLHFTSVS